MHRPEATLASLTSNHHHRRVDPCHCPVSDGKSPAELRLRLQPEFSWLSNSQSRLQQSHQAASACILRPRQEPACLIYIERKRGGCSYDNILRRRLKEAEIGWEDCFDDVLVGGFGCYRLPGVPAGRRFLFDPLALSTLLVAGEEE
ncbi:uncharacterized protein A4U43_C08F28190 [Asparagus officinalis]|nr:uncharacterized protein A4U43_C08F28190 [Asparagus officinalis]